MPAIDPHSISVTVGLPPPKVSEIAGTGIAPALITAVGSVLSSAAWPIGLIIMAMMFKRQIADLMGRVRSVKAPGGFELTTEALIAGLSQQAEPEAANAAIVEQTAQLPPIDAIVTAWVDVERAILRLYDRTQLVSTGTRASPARKLEFLRQSGTISPSLYGDVRPLNQIRNLVVHNPDEMVSQEAVKTYVANAKTVADMIDRIPGDPSLT